MSMQFEVGKLAGEIGLLRNLVFVVLGTLVAIVSGGIAIYMQLATVQTDVALLKRDVADIAGRTKRMEAAIDALKSAQTQAQTTLGRIETRLTSIPPVPPTTQFLALGNTDGKLIKEILGPSVQTWKEPVAFRVKLGEMIKGVEIRPVPTALIEQIPELQGLGYTVDSAKSIVFVREPANVVIGVVHQN